MTGLLPLPALTTADVLRAMATDPERLGARTGRLVMLAAGALEQARELAHPAVALARHPVVRCHGDVVRLGGGRSLRGAGVAAALAGADEVAAVALTIGPALEARVRACQAATPALALALDAAGSALVQALATQAREELRAEAADRGLATGTPIGPGAPGWPVVPGQRELLALLDPWPAGLQLLESGMLVPAKSLTFLLGLGRELAPGAEPCTACDHRPRCRMRVAG